MGFIPFKNIIKEVKICLEVKNQKELCPQLLLLY